jgi:hypothetical protein
MRDRLAVALIVAFVGSAMGAGQTSQPVAAGPLADTPKAALKSFAVALDAGDAATLHYLLDATNPTEQKIAGSTVDMAVALADLNHALVSKFGPEQAKTVVGDSAGQLQQSLAAITAASEKVTGDTAVVSISPTTQGTMTLRKVEGAWKISLAEQAKGLTPQQVDQVVAMVSTELKQLKEMTAEVKAGKFATAADAAGALHEKMGSMPTTGPSTRPGP